MLKNPIQKNITMALVLVTLLSHQSGNAEPDEKSGKRRGPPPEAFEACAELSSGDSCTMTGRRGKELQGTCIVPPKHAEEELVCKPERAPKDGQGREKPEESGS